MTPPPVRITGGGAQKFRGTPPTARRAKYYHGFRDVISDRWILRRQAATSSRRIRRAFENVKVVAVRGVIVNNPLNALCELPLMVAVSVIRPY